MDEREPSPPSQTLREAPILNYATPTRRPPARWLAGAALFCGLASPVTLILSFAGESAGLLLLCPILAMIATGLGIASLVLTPMPRPKESSSYATDLRDARRLAGIGTVLGGAIVLLTLFFLINERLDTPARRDSHRRVICASNLRKIGEACRLYANANNGQYPLRLDQLLTDAGMSPEAFICPSGNEEKATGATMAEIVVQFNKPQHHSYVYVGAGLTIDSPSTNVVAYERRLNHEAEGLHVLYAGGWTVWLDAQQARQFLSQMGQ